MYCTRRLRPHTGKSISSLDVRFLSHFIAFANSYLKYQYECIRNLTTSLNEKPKQSYETPISSESNTNLQDPRHIKAGVLLSRSPQVTRPLTSFEKAFYLYQRRLNERLAIPFPRYFYVRKGTPEALQWTRKLKVRRTAARDIGLYHAYGKESWNDELLLGAPESEPEHQVNALLKDTRTVITEEGEDEKDSDDSIEDPVSRITDADAAKDEKSLNRLLDRTLYLLVKDDQNFWRLPSDILIVKENLHQVACLRIYH